MRLTILRDPCTPMRMRASDPTSLQVAAGNSGLAFPCAMTITIPRGTRSAAQPRYVTRIIERR
jgi:hypothetical protein